MTDNFVKLFDFMGKNVRVVTIDDAPWFVAIDIINMLGLASYSGTQSHLKKLAADEKRVVSNRDVPKYFLGRAPTVSVVSEPGMYKLIQSSTKPESVEFDRWVRHTVLPTLRKDKQYNVGEEKVLTGEMTMEEMTLMVINNLQGKAKRLEAERDAALETVAKQDERLNFITVAEYLAMDKRYQSHSHKTKRGQLAKMLCESRGLRTSKAHTTYTDRYGRTHNVVIGQYPRDVLEEAEGLLAA